MTILGQTDPTETVTTILSYPVETLLAGVLLLIGVVGIIIARAFSRWVANMDRIFARRDEMDHQLLGLIDSTGKAVSSHMAASTRSAVAAEATAERMISLDTTLTRYHTVQTRKVLPALKFIYQRILAVERKIDQCNTEELRLELKGLRQDLQTAAWLTIQNASPEDISQFIPKEGTTHES